MNAESVNEATGNEQTGGLVLNLECTLAAPPEEVFRMLTESAELVKWWGPHGFIIPAAEVNLAEGGRYRFRMTPPDGEPFHLSGEFLEIDPPWRLVYTFRWEEPAPDDRETVVDLSLGSTGTGTRLVLSQGPFLTDERLELHRNGWTESFEKLQAVLWRHLRKPDPLRSSCRVMIRPEHERFFASPDPSPCPVSSCSLPVQLPAHNSPSHLPTVVGSPARRR